MPTLMNRRNISSVTLIYMTGCRFSVVFPRLSNCGPRLLDREVLTLVIPVRRLLLRIRERILVVLLPPFIEIRHCGDLGTASVSRLQIRVGMTTIRNTYRYVLRLNN